MGKTPRRRVVGMVAMVLGAALALGAAPAMATTYPGPGGSDFSSGLGGWSSKAEDCYLIGAKGGLGLCKTVNELAVKEGLPRPAIATRFGTLANAVGAFTGHGVWASPRFTVAEEPEPIASPFLRLDRRARIAALDIGGTAEYKVLLIDEGSGSVTQIAAGTLAAADQVWRTQDVAVRPEAIAVGHAYHLEIHTFITSQTAQALLGEMDVFYDNVGLSTARPGIKASDLNPAARLIRFDSRVARATRKGQFANEIRLRVYCKKTSLRRCEGTGKVRTVDKVDPGLERSAPKRRVTLGAAAYICPRDRICFIKVPIRDRTRRWAAKRGGVQGLRVEALVTVLDEKGVQQTLSRRMRLRAS